MQGWQFRANRDFFRTAKDNNGKSIGRGKITEGTIVSVLDSEIRNGVRFCKLDHSIGWVGTNNRIWDKLDQYGYIPVQDYEINDEADDFEER